MKRKSGLIVWLCCLILLAVQGYADDGQGEKYKGGKVLTIFERDAKFMDMPVLYAQESDTIYIDPFFVIENMGNSACEWEEPQQSISVFVHETQLCFTADEKSVDCHIGNMEREYRMDEPVVSYKEKVWIPADDFFFLIGCSTASVHAEPGRKEWIPGTDYLCISEPEYHIPDLLFSLMRAENAADWMFSYEKDFHYNKDQLMKLMTGSTMIHVAYDTLTMKWDTICSYAIMPAEQFANGVKKLSNTLLKTEFEMNPGWYDQEETGQFIKAMLTVGKEELSNSAVRRESRINFYATLLDALQEGYEGDLVKWLDGCIKYVDDFIYFHNDKLPRRIGGVVEAAKNDDVLKMHNSIMSGMGTVQNVFMCAFSMITAYQDTLSYSEDMASAIKVYLDAAKHKSILSESQLKAVRQQYGKEKNKIVSTITTGGMDILNAEVATWVVRQLTKNSFIGIGLSMIDPVVSFCETLQGYPLVKMEQPRAFLMSLYAMDYAQDAWYQLAVAYNELDQTGMPDSKKLTDTAWLAVNYLKSCIVTIEAAQNTVNEKFKGTVYYKNTQTDLYQLYTYLKTLTEYLSDERTSLGVWGTTKKMPVTIYPMVVFDEDYYHYIVNTLMPEYGMADWSNKDRKISYSGLSGQKGKTLAHWDKRAGIVAAKIMDLDQDDEDEMVLVRIEKSKLDNFEHLWIDLYGRDEIGNIVLYGSKSICKMYPIGFDQIVLGVVNRAGKPYLFAEYYSQAYFADGYDELYLGFSCDKKGLKQAWTLGKTAGGSSDIVYSLIDYEKRTDEVLCYLYGPKAMEITPAASSWQALRIGYDRLGLQWQVYGSTVEVETRQYSPSLRWNEDASLIFTYDCYGEKRGSYDQRMMHSRIKDETDLIDHIVPLWRISAIPK